jgi:UDP-N-acetylglucosamine 4-epimerase
LFELIRSLLEPHFPLMKDIAPIYREFRAGDVRHSLADIGKARNLLGYSPTYRVDQGLQVIMNRYIHNLAIV